MSILKCQSIEQEQYDETTTTNDDYSARHVSGGEA